MSQQNYAHGVALESLCCNPFRAGLISGMWLPWAAMVMATHPRAIHYVRKVLGMSREKEHRRREPRFVDVAQRRLIDSSFTLGEPVNRFCIRALDSSSSSRCHRALDRLMDTLAAPSSRDW